MPSRQGRSNRSGVATFWDDLAPFRVATVGVPKVGRQAMGLASLPSTLRLRLEPYDAGEGFRLTGTGAQYSGDRHNALRHLDCFGGIRISEIEIHLGALDPNFGLAQGRRGRKRIPQLDVTDQC